jgi:predicted nucleic acid-binding protein
LAWLKGEAQYKAFLPAIENMLRECRDKKIEILTSAITITELLCFEVPDNTRRQLDDLFRRDIHKVVDADIVIAKRAREYRRFCKDKGIAGLKTPDAVHIATAVINEVDELHTFDQRILNHNGGIAEDGIAICRPPAFSQPLQGDLL